MNLLENEYVQLRSYRVAMRKELDAVEKAASIDSGKLYGPDGWRNRYARIAAELRGTEKRWQELCVLLRRPASASPVKLSPTPRTRAQPVRLRATRTVPNGYMTKVMRPS